MFSCDFCSISYISRIIIWLSHWSYCPLRILGSVTTDARSLLNGRQEYSSFASISSLKAIVSHSLYLPAQSGPFQLSSALWKIIVQGEMNTCRVLVGKPEGKSLLGKPGRS
jgi:hypothetical protein